MITDVIISVLIAVPYLLLTGLEILDFSFSFPGDMFEIIKDLTVGVAYVLPVTHFLLLFTLRINILIFKCIWSVIIRIKSFIPTFGS